MLTYPMVTDLIKDQKMRNIDIFLTVSAMHILTLLLIALIHLIARYIVDKLYKKNTPIATHSTRIPNLSENDLSDMFNSADTKLYEIDSPYEHNVNLQTGRSSFTRTIIESAYENEQRAEHPENDPLIKQHIQYLQNNRTDTTSDNHSRAILGACVQNIFAQNSYNIPTISLTHHMINHIYTRNYMSLLSNIINQGILDKEKYIIKDDTLSTQNIILQYNSSLQKQFFVDAEFTKKLVLKDNPSIHFPFTGHIHFLISQSENNPEILQYSEGEILLRATINIMDPTQFRPQQFSTTNNIQLTLPSFTIHTHSAEQLINNTSITNIATTSAPITIPKHF